MSLCLSLAHSPQCPWDIALTNSGLFYDDELGLQNERDKWSQPYRELTRSPPFYPHRRRQRMRSRLMSDVVSAEPSTQWSLCWEQCIGSGILDEGKHLCCVMAALSRGITRSNSSHIPYQVEVLCPAFKTM